MSAPKNPYRPPAEPVASDDSIERESRRTKKIVRMTSESNVQAFVVTLLIGGTVLPAIFFFSRSSPYFWGSIPLAVLTWLWSRHQR